MNTERVRAASTLAIIGGMVWFLQSIISDVLFPQLTAPGTIASTVNSVIATAVLALLLVGFLGVQWGGGLSGGWFGKIVFGVAVLGHILMVVGGVLTILGAGPLADPDPVSLIFLLGRLIAVVFTLLTGIAVLAVGRWQGWARYVVLVIGIFPLLTELLPVLLGGEPNAALNGLWGLLYVALGAALRRHSAPMMSTAPATALR